jgi:UDP-glucose 4-epimerase
MRVLITGSTGFIGGSLGRYAVRAGHTVMGTGRSPEPGKEWPGLYAPGDTTAESLSEIVSNFAPDVLFHAAGTASVGASLLDPLADFRGSVSVCANMLEAVRRSGKGPLVFIPSSASVYGNPAALPVNEEAAIQPISPYGFHKAMCETLAREYAGCFGLKIIACRFFSVFGPAQHRLLVWDLYQQFTGAGPEAWIEGTGTETRDFLHIEDAAAGLFELADTQRLEPGEAVFVNVASAEETSVLDLAKIIKDLTGSAKSANCRGIERPGDPRRWRADVSLLHSLVPAWQPRPLRETLAQCVATWESQPQSRSYGA